MTEETKVEGDILARCPFCGGEAKVSRFFATRHPPMGSRHVTGYRVFCLTCGSAGKSFDTSKVNDPRKEAMAAWNNRSRNVQDGI